jgi:hypothetical protein
MIYAPKPYEKCNPKKKNGFALAAANRFLLDHFTVNNKTYLCTKYTTLK